MESYITNPIFDTPDRREAAKRTIETLLEPNPAGNWLDFRAVRINADRLNELEGTDPHGQYRYGGDHTFYCGKDLLAEVARQEGLETHHDSGHWSVKARIRLKFAIEEGLQAAYSLIFQPEYAAAQFRNSMALCGWRCRCTSRHIKALHAMAEYPAATRLTYVIQNMLKDRLS